MKVLITGATGLIGSELVPFLLKKGISVNFLTTSISKIENLPNYNGYYWNPNQGTIDENCLIGVDVIIHLAGASIAKKWTTEYKEEILESRIVTSNLLFKVLSENPHQVKQLISASGTAIYPNSATNIYSESSTDFDDSFLGNVVLKWEESVDLFALLNIKVCKLRTGVVFSKKGGIITEMMKPIKNGFGAAFGNGDQMESWIHIDDLIALYYFAIVNSWEGTYNAVAPNPISNKKLTQLIAKHLKKPLILPNVPKFILKIILGEMHKLLFSDKKVSAQKIMDYGFQFKFSNPENAIKNILSL